MMVDQGGILPMTFYNYYCTNHPSGKIFPFKNHPVTGGFWISNAVNR
jgi:hypothetical protein